MPHVRPHRTLNPASLASLAATLVLAATLAAPADGGARTRACRPPNGGQVLAVRPQIDLFGYYAADDVSGGLFACFRPTGRQFQVAPQGALYYPPPSLSAEGSFLAGAYLYPGDFPTSVYLLDLRRKKPLVTSVNGLTGVIGPVVFKRDGALAFATCAEGGGGAGALVDEGCSRPAMPGSGGILMATRLGSPHSGYSVLDTAADPFSLTLHGSTLSWTDSGQRHSTLLR